MAGLNAARADVAEASAAEPETRARELRARIRERAAIRAGESAQIPIATVSGIASTTAGMIAWFDRATPVTIITTKSFQLQPNPGNREPIITEALPGCFGNAVGLRNPGIRTAVAQLAELRGKGGLSALLLVSLSGTTAEDFAELARHAAPHADMVELNYSCPHATKGYGSDIGKDRDAIRDITAAVVEAIGEIPVIVKLTPNVPDIAEMAEAAISGGAAGVSAINTVGPALYRHPEANAGILTNPPDGRGGQSGEWVREIAVQAVRAIRDRIGSIPVLIAMGGVATPEDAAILWDAGADVVGVGSALARSHQRDWPGYLQALANGPARAAGRPPAPGSAHPLRARAALRPVPSLRAAAGMELRPHTVVATREIGGELFELDVEPALGVEPGQSVFIWIPGIGEKPFAPACTNSREDNGSPVTTFLVKRRGPVTRAIGALRAGNRLYIRGPYGDAWTLPEGAGAGGSALLLAAGSGMATVPAVAERFHAAGYRVHAAFGVRSSISGSLVLATTGRWASVDVVPDQGQEGRVLQRIASAVSDRAAAGHPVRQAWVCGPQRFMDSAIHALRAEGLPAGKIALSLEQMMRCGVGMCGECHHHGLLTCQYGTVISAQELAP